MVKYSHSEDMALPKKPKSVEMTSTRDEKVKRTVTSSNLLADAAAERKGPGAKNKVKGQCYEECGLCCMPVETMREAVPERGVRDASRSLSAPGPMSMRREVVTAGAERAKAATAIQKFMRGRSLHIARAMRTELMNAPPGPAYAACNKKTVSDQLDAMSEFIKEHLGTNVWARAVRNAPDEWEEEDFRDAIKEIILQPTQTKHIGLLARPTKAERQLLMLASLTGGQRAAKKVFMNEKAAATIIQKNYRSRSKHICLAIRLQLEGIPAKKAAKATAGGLDAIAKLIGDVLGTNVWARAITNAPDEWEEEDFVNAMHEAILRPKDSPHLWMLAKPTKYEKALLSVFRPKAINAHI